MGRRRDQVYAGCGMSGLCDPWIDLLAGQMSALTGFCALGKLDLDLLGTDLVSAGHTETSAGHLLDGRASVMLGTGALQSFIALTAFTAVGLAVEMIHGNGQCLVGFL